MDRSRLLTRQYQALPAALMLVTLLTFSLKPATASYSIAYNFAGSPSDCANPVSTLVYDSVSENYYGTTLSGGKYGDGTVYCLNPNFGVTVIHSFNGTDGSSPASTLVVYHLTATSSTLFGTTLKGGKSGLGVVFKIDPSGSPFQVLHSFLGGTGDGSYPWAGVIVGSDGNLYGTTLSGGQFNLGTTYSIRRVGTGFTVTHSFAGASTPGAPADGATPYARLFEYQKGMLAGTTLAGGKPNSGTVYTEKFSGVSYSMIHQFMGAPDGANPTAEVILIPTASGGPVLWGTTFNGGAKGDGTIYSLSPTGSGFVNEYNFAGGPDDGANPFGALIQSTANGNIYGTTVNGGSGGVGTVYAAMPASPPPIPEAIAHAFSLGEGENPYAALIEFQGGGALMSTTRNGGAAFDGIIFLQSP